MSTQPPRAAQFPTHFRLALRALGAATSIVGALCLTAPAHAFGAESLTHKGSQAEPSELALAAKQPSTRQERSTVLDTAEVELDPDWSPNPIDVPDDGIIPLDNASGFQEAIATADNEELGTVLREASERKDTIVLTSETGQVLGFAQHIAAPEAEHIASWQVPLFETSQAFSSTQPALVAASLENAALHAHLERSGQLEQRLKEAIRDIQQRNQTIVELQLKIKALDAFRQNPSAATLSAAQLALGSADTEAQALLAISAHEAASPLALQTATQTTANYRSLIDRNNNLHQVEMVKMQDLSTQHQDSILRISSILKQTLDQKSSKVIGTIRSTPIDIGTVQWNAGEASGNFDLSRVPAGQHHLILDFTDLGFTLVSEVTVSHESNDSPLVDTGATEPTLVWGIALLTAGFALSTAMWLRRDGSRCSRSAKLKNSRAFQPCDF